MYYNMIDLLKQDKTIWDLFIRRTEYNTSNFDQHKRFLYKFEVNRNPINPVVSEFLIKKGKKLEWPDNYNFAVCLTHDIDQIYPTFKYRIYTSLKYGFKGLFNKSFNRLLYRDNPYWNFKEIIEIEKKYNAKSTFYFIATEKGFHGRHYKIEALRNVLKFIKSNGWDIGLHGAYSSYDNYKKMIEEKNNLENVTADYINSYRNHYLRFKIPDTWENLNKAGIKCDTTFGYPDNIGFRNGLCHPFKPYNLEKNQTIDIWELPLNIMDSTLFQYKKLNVDSAWNKCKKLIDKVEQLNGLVTILWHNSSFDDIYRKGWGRLYERLLDYCYKRNAWLASVDEIIEWVNENEWW